MFQNTGNADSMAASNDEEVVDEIPVPVLSEHTPKSDTVATVSSEAAEQLTQKFYPAIAGQRDTIASYYVSRSEIDNVKVPSISFNGNAYATGQDFEKMITDLEPLSFELDTLDAHAINKILSIDGKVPQASDSKGRNMTVMVNVTGNCKVGDPEADDNRTFCDTFLLVPNPDFLAQKKKGKVAREWLIQSHNFRFTTS